MYEKSFVVETQETELIIMEGAGKQLELRIRTEQGEFEPEPFGWAGETALGEGDFAGQGKLPIAAFSCPSGRQRD